MTGLQRVLIPSTESVVVERFQLPSPSPGEVTVRMLRAGICGSDLHTYRSGHPWLEYPIRPGHEIAGVIAELGEGVEAIAVGQEIYVNPVLSCGSCRQCARGLTNLCDQLVGVGSHIPGGMAEAFNVPARAVIPIPKGISVLAASLIEPAATVARAVSRVGDLGGATVAVIGAGSIGLLTIGMARAGGCARLVAADLSAEKCRGATEWGADSAVDGSAGQVVPRILEAAGHPPEVVFDCVGSPATFSLALELVAKAGTVVVVGADHGEASVQLALVQDGEVTITGVAMYTDPDFARAAEYVAGNAEMVSGLVSSEFSVSQAPEAYARAASGRERKVQLVGSPAPQ